MQYKFAVNDLSLYLDTHPEESSSGHTPRKITSIYDIGKYQTEALKAKRNIDTLLWMAKVRGDENKIKLLADEIGFNLSGIKIINSNSIEESAKTAVKLVSTKKADFVMKGIYLTDLLLYRVFLI